MRHKTALVIDDELPILRIVKAVLENSGYIAQGTSSGARGVEIAVQEKPDIIILDRYMPETDGNEILKILKSDKVTASIPVVMLTGENKIDEVKSSIALGASAYIIKPFTSAAFMQKVEAVLKNK